MCDSCIWKWLSLLSKTPFSELALRKKQIFPSTPSRTGTGSGGEGTYENPVSLWGCVSFSTWNNSHEIFHLLSRPSPALRRQHFPCNSTALCVSFTCWLVFLPGEGHRWYEWPERACIHFHGDRATTKSWHRKEMDSGVSQNPGFPTHYLWPVFPSFTKVQWSPLQWVNAKWENSRKEPGTVPPRPCFRQNTLKSISTLPSEKWLLLVTHPWARIIQHNKNDEDVRIPGRLDGCLDSVFTLKEQAASVRDHQEELCGVCSKQQGRRRRRETTGVHYWQ